MSVKVQNIRDSALDASVELGLTILNSLPDHVAVLDRYGTIIAVNDAWNNFAVKNGATDLSRLFVGANYLDACRQAIRAGDDSAEKALLGIESVLHGLNNYFAMDYECPSPSKERWFKMTVLRRDQSHTPVVITHSNITDRKLAQNELIRAYSEIQKLKERLEAENVYLKEEIDIGHGFGQIIGRSDPIKYVLFRVQQVASTDTTVFILGETGTGKSLVARAIHEASKRKDRPMVHVNCAVLPANLIESELFGREKGAFTGALARQIGRFDLADTGTIFLDEIGELPIELQGKLLKVIEQSEFERLGSPHPVKVDVRIIASTNRNLEEEIAQGRFRQDLFYRLNVFPITVPPLRQRREDIPALVAHFVAKFSKQMGKPVHSIADRVMTALRDYSWPGNVRELQNVIERAVITSSGPVLSNAELLQPFAGAAPTPIATSDLEAVERAHIVKALKIRSWQIEGTKGAAHALGIKPSTLRSRMKKLGIKRPQGH